jgi:signal peptidase II
VKKAIALILGVLFIDQFIKIWIKTHMYLGETYRVSGEWFYLHFVENPGMAFGLQLGGDYGKLLLSVFRLAAVAGIGYYLWKLFSKNVRPLLLVCVALIFAGAMGNILDSIFYGKFFNTSDQWDQNVAEFMPEAGGYAGWLHGQVVDMFYFPVLEGHWPMWLPDPMNDSYPGWVPRAGEEFLFFRPVFNIADAAISVGVFLLIIFQRRLFGKQEELSERKILVTNIFFGGVVFVISLFLLLTFTGLFSETHPISVMGRVALFVLSLGIGYAFFEYLRRYPRYVPAEENGPVNVTNTHSMLHDAMDKAVKEQQQMKKEEDPDTTN